MAKLRIKSGDKFDHKHYGPVEVVSTGYKTVYFRKADGSCNEQHVNYFLMFCDKIKMNVFVPGSAFADTIFTILENKLNYRTY